MPDKASFPKHYHSYNTEAFYIIKGNGIVKTINSEINIKSGDVIVFSCEKAETHKIINPYATDKLLYRF